ncbi:hypothetical protein [Bradyrhizobium sp.]|jgi:hypothetical protein|uniref:hypothetical protein n=1 Tax=Bradyrhizobium sp. TaxID=376 RepID=UPI002E0858D3|nr:hypothetical protein [Bradyrhizobium sp.]
MLSDDDYIEAIRGNTPEMAFVKLEAKFRQKMNDDLKDNDESGFFDACALEYINHCLATAKALDLDFLDPWTLPSGKRQQLWDHYRDLLVAIDNFKVQIQVANARGVLRYSVGLSHDDKEKLRRYVDEIKTIVDNAPLDGWKKDRLYNLINAFLAEVDRDRAPWDRFADLVIGLAHLGGQAATELRPVRELIDSIARLLGRTKEIEDSTPKLPKSTPRRIPAPSKDRPKPDVDDDIPF